MVSFTRRILICIMKALVLDLLNLLIASRAPISEDNNEYSLQAYDNMSLSDL